VLFFAVFSIQIFGCFAYHHVSEKLIGIQFCQQTFGGEEMHTVVAVVFILNLTRPIVSLLPYREATQHMRNLLYPQRCS